MKEDEALMLTEERVKDRCVNILPGVDVSDMLV